MARYTGPREKIERRLGEKLFLKGERSLSPKTASVRKPYPPGIHGKKRAKKLSEFGMQLRSKQKIRNTYRLLEKQFKNYVKGTLEKKKKDPYEDILNKLEHRLDNTVYRMGLAQSRDQARQLVNHGHILVNGRRMSIPSHTVRVGDEISVREASKRSQYFASSVPQWIKKVETPKWLELDKDKLTAKVKGRSNVQESGINTGDMQAIIEFYSR